MPGTIRWDASLEIGVERVDAQHKRLVGMVAEYVEALGRGEAEEHTSELFSRLGEYAVEHFADEEALMDEIQYERRSEHKRFHTQMRHDIKEMRRRIYQKELPAPKEVSSFLKEWLIGHVLAQDMPLGQAVREHRAGKPEKKRAAAADNGEKERTAEGRTEGATPQAPQEGKSADKAE